MTARFSRIAELTRTKFSISASRSRLHKKRVAAQEKAEKKYKAEVLQKHQEKRKALMATHHTFSKVKMPQKKKQLDNSDDEDEQNTLPPPTPAYNAANRRSTNMRKQTVPSPPPPSAATPPPSQSAAKIAVSFVEAMAEAAETAKDRRADQTEAHEPSSGTNSEMGSSRPGSGAARKSTRRMSLAFGINLLEDFLGGNATNALGRDTSKDSSHLQTRGKVFSFEDTRDMSTRDKEVRDSSKIVEIAEEEEQKEKERQKRREAQANFVRLAKKAQAQGIKGERWNTPTMEQQYRQLRQAFEEVDKDQSLELTWHQMQQLSRKINLPVDHNTFRRMDRDGSGKIEFNELLKCVFPEFLMKEINALMHYWGPPHTVEVIENLSAKTPWHEKLDKHSVGELKDIYKSICSDERIGMTLKDLEHHTSRKYLPGSILEEVFKEADLTQTGALTIDEFADIMEDTYLFHKYNKQQAVHLYFANLRKEDDSIPPVQPPSPQPAPKQAKPRPSLATLLPSLAT
eukprot:TRINITY_DN86748_c0_g1_i1.p1 TRINITY_DN86748_c0_g1~~TRINITY_DN86748_c0_g1_i1.p1  ORF type:complete len:514 (+),score=43.55 TRINITY_DN86748_c0_g1_i1:50-1591(+)